MVLKQLVVIFFFLLTLAVASSSSASALNNTVAKPNCLAQCGGIDIPYPFGVGRGCYRDDDFELICDASGGDGRELLFWKEHRVTEVLLVGEISITVRVSYDCYNDDGTRYAHELFYVNGGQPIPFTISGRRNKFTTIGCDTQATLKAVLGGEFKSGCISYCRVLESLEFLSCDSAIGCCQTSIPPGIASYELNLSSIDKFTVTGRFNSCSYAFLVDYNRFNLSNRFFFGDKAMQTRVPVVLDWSIKNDNSNCAACVSEKSGCRNNSVIEDGSYLCNCSDGYDGNPYLVDGCKDVDECKEDKHDCEKPEYCHNEDGSFDCICPRGWKGDGRVGNGCISDGDDHRLHLIIIGTSVSFLIVLVAGPWSYWMYKKRKLIKLKEQFFQQNGGLLLNQLACSSKMEVIKIFTAEELESATNNYHESQIIGQGGSGTVYKGILPDERIVAIKKAKIVDESQIEQFINEIVILYKMNHRNMVRLLGCCLETEVPMLVYEFIDNGTLHNHLHDKSLTGSMSWENRLRIAAETAGALAFLHSASSVPIIHRDVKSTNILLDKNLTAKVADFGASRLVPLEKSEVTTLVQGTLGYLDPEYFFSGQLSDKSDVYSFGVVLAELLTGEKPIGSNRPEEERMLAKYFVMSMKKNRLFQVMEDRVVKEGEMGELIAVAQLARGCLMVKSDERPAMKDVAAELERLRRRQLLPWILEYHDEDDSVDGEDDDFNFEGNFDASDQTSDGRNDSQV